MTSQNPSIRLAILDDYARIAQSHFASIPNLTVDSFPETLNPSNPTDLDALVKRLEPYDAISTMRERTPFPRGLQERLPNLKLLLTTSARNASIDLACAAERGVIVTGTKGDRPSDEAQVAKLEDLPPPAGYSGVTQHTWALLLGLCSRVVQDDAALKSSGEAWQNGLTVSLAGKTLGIVGLGKLGIAMARVGSLGFGMKVVAWSQNLTPKRAREAAVNAGLSEESVRAVSKDELFRSSDAISLNLVLSDRTRGVVGKEELGMMKKSAILVNTARGPLIDEEALIDVLKEGKIKGAALDVFDIEPLPADSPWRDSKSWESDVVLSPHMGYCNAGTMHRWYQEQAENVERWMTGEALQNQL